MPRRRHTPAITCALVASATLLVSACGGDANGGASSASTSSSTSSPTSTPSSETSESSPTDEPTPNPYAINCHLITQKVVEEWTGDVVPEGVETTDDESSDDESSDTTGEDADTTTSEDAVVPVGVEETENGCRVVSSSEEGALIVQWQYLDVPASSDDQGIVNDVSQSSEAVEIEEGVTAVRSESDVDPTRKTRLYVTFDNSRTLYAEATATLDRPRSMADLRRMTDTIVTTYADQPPLPTPPVDPQGSSTPASTSD